MYQIFPAFDLQIQGSGPCLVGSLTGAVASQRVAEAFKGWLATDGNRSDSVNAKASLTVRPTSQTGTKVGVSCPLSCNLLH